MFYLRTYKNKSLFFKMNLEKPTQFYRKYI